MMCHMFTNTDWWYHALQEFSIQIITLIENAIAVQNMDPMLAALETFGGTWNHHGHHLSEASAKTG